MPPRILLSLALILLPALLQAAPDVVLQENAESVILSNGPVTAVIQKDNGELIELRYQNQNVITQPAYLDWQTGRANHLYHANFSIVRTPEQTGGDLAEVVISQTYKDQNQPRFDIALHYLMKRGESGLYAYATFSHPADYPQAGFGQSRYVMRVDDKLFDTIAIDETRFHQLPPVDTPEVSIGPKESMRFTAGPWKDQITDKYHYFTDAGDHYVHGWTGDKLGCWIVYGSTEDQNGGPTKQHNTAHWGRMLLKILTCGHYGAAPVSIDAGQSWSKMYGPWLIYLNSGQGSANLWADAQVRAQNERTSWPYPWIQDALYPHAGERAAVTGRLVLHDAEYPDLNTANAWIGLAAASPDWQQQSLGYQFWVHASQDGSFKIPDIRPGNYTLYSFVSGVFEEYRHDGLELSSGQQIDLGKLDWTPVHHGHVLWQIGIPDRTAKEFRHGDDYRHWGLWKKFAEEFPDGVNFIIGQSHERTDWNYAHVSISGHDVQLICPDWNVFFDLAERPSPDGTATLRFGFAGAHNAGLSVLVNGQLIGNKNRLETDNAMIRAGIHGQYSTWDIPFSAKLLQNGTNKITLQLHVKAEAQNIMYDALRLELSE